MKILFSLVSIMILPLSVDAQTLRLMSPDRHKSFLDKIPPEVLDAIGTDDLAIYTERELPPAFQQNGGFHAPTASQVNANIFFPWRTPAGVDGAKGVKTFRFVAMKKPMLVWKVGNTTKWRFQPETVFGEVLMQTANKADYTFEVRVRERVNNGWVMDVFRPFPNPDHLKERLSEIAPENPQVKRMLSHLDKPSPELLELRDRNPQKRVFDRFGAWDFLPRLPERVVADLLTSTPFKSSFSERWVTSGGRIGFAPSNKDAGFNIVPPGYDAAPIRVSNDACMTCHNTAGKNGRQFDRTWAGLVRGDDDILSFYPVDPSSISPNLNNRQVKLRPELVKAGLIKELDAPPAKKEFVDE